MALQFINLYLFHVYEFKNLKHVIKINSEKLDLIVLKKK